MAKGEKATTSSSRVRPEYGCYQRLNSVDVQAAKPPEYSGAHGGKKLPPLGRTEIEIPEDGDHGDKEEIENPTAALLPSESDTLICKQEDKPKAQANQFSNDLKGNVSLKKNKEVISSQKLELPQFLVKHESDKPVAAPLNSFPVSRQLKKQATDPESASIDVHDNKVLTTLQDQFGSCLQIVTIKQNVTEKTKEEGGGFHHVGTMSENFEAVTITSHSVEQNTDMAAGDGCFIGYTEKSIEENSVMKAGDCSQTLTTNQNAGLQIGDGNHTETINQDVVVEAVDCNHNETSNQNAVLEAQESNHTETSNQNATMEARDGSHTKTSYQNAVLEAGESNHTETSNQNATMEARDGSHTETSYQNAVFEAGESNHTKTSNQNAAMEARDGSHTETINKNAMLGSENGNHTGTCNQNAAWEARDGNHTIESEALKAYDLEQIRTAHQIKEQNKASISGPGNVVQIKPINQSVVDNTSFNAKDDTRSRSIEDKTGAKNSFPDSVTMGKGFISLVTSFDEGKAFEPETHSLKTHVCPSGNYLTEVIKEIPEQWQKAYLVRELGKEQQKERLSITCQYDEGVFHYHGDATWQKDESKYLSYLDAHQESVGLIQRESTPVGTCFRIGPKRDGYLLTDYHVFSSIYPPGKYPTDDNLNFLGHPTVKVWFPDKNRGQKLYNLKPKLHYGCPTLDYAVLEMKGENFTKPFPKFGSVDEGRSQQYYLHGYHGNIMEVDETVKILDISDSQLNIAKKWSNIMFDVNGYSHKVFEFIEHSLEQKEKVPLITRLRHGASGGPGFHLNDDGKPVVSLMYLRGYPSQYYYNLSNEEIMNFPACYLVEQALKISEVYSSISDLSPELAKQLFQFH